MSWDVQIVKFTHGPYLSIDDIPKDETIDPLGTLADIHRAVSQLFLGTDWSDSHWGMFDSPFGSVEFNVGQRNPIDGMMLHVRAGEEVVALIIELCKTQNWQAIDCSDGEFLDQAKQPEKGLQAWREYRDRVLGKPE